MRQIIGNVSANCCHQSTRGIGPRSPRPPTHPNPQPSSLSSLGFGKTIKAKLFVVGDDDQGHFTSPDGVSCSYANLIFEIADFRDIPFDASPHASAYLGIGIGIGIGFILLHFCWHFIMQLPE